MGKERMGITREMEKRRREEKRMSAKCGEKENEERFGNKGRIVGKREWAMEIQIKGEGDKDWK